MDEAKAIFAKGYDESLPVMKAIGLRQLRSYFQGKGPLDEVIEDAKRESRRFAKRQMTWFRNQPPKGVMIETQEQRANFLLQLQDVKL